MADSKITALTSISTSTDPAVDPLVIVDVSDTTMAASGTSKKVTLNNLLSSSPTATGALTVTGLVTAGSATITGAATVGTTLGVTGVSTFAAGTALLPALTTTGDVNTGIYYPAADTFAVTTGGTERARFNSTGAFVLAGGTTGANGIGVAFPATQSASSDANTLDDYEEGTFTPTIATGATGVTYSTQEGSYTKVGRLVTVLVQITTSAATRNGSIFNISGLPFSSSNFGSGVISYSNSGFVSTAGGNKPNMYVTGSTVDFYTSSGSSFVGTAIATDAFDVRFTATYFV